MTIRLNNVFPLLLVATMSAVVGLVVFLFIHNSVSEGKNLKYLTEDEQVRWNWYNFKNENNFVVICQQIAFEINDGSLPLTNVRKIVILEINYESQI